MGARLGIAFAVIVALSIAVYLFPVREWVDAATAWAKGLGTPGLLVLVVIHGLLTTLPLPNSWLQLSAGAMFGTQLGFVVGWLGAVLGGVLHMVLPRHLARGLVQKWVARRPKLRRLDAAMQRSGWTTVTLCRLSPFVPYAGSGYVFGLSGLPMWGLSAITATCIVPSSLMYAWFGSLSTHAEPIGPVGVAAVVAGVLVTVAAGIAAKRLADPPGERH